MAAAALSPLAPRAFLWTPLIPPRAGPWGSLVYPWRFGTFRPRFKSGRTHPRAETIIGGARIQAAMARTPRAATYFRDGDRKGAEPIHRRWYTDRGIRELNERLYAPPTLLRFRPIARSHPSSARPPLALASGRIT